MYYETKGILEKIKGSVICKTDDLNADWVKEQVNTTGTEPEFF